MATFAQMHRVSAVMGAHIELSSTGKQYPAGATYQPDEGSLPLTTQDLSKLDQLLQRAGDKPEEIATPRFVVQPR
jgi:hypothetical protein